MARRNPGTRFQGHEATNSGVWNECFPAAGVAGSKEGPPLFVQGKGRVRKGPFPPSLNGLDERDAAR